MKRYEIDSGYYNYNVEESPDGEWVRWDDVRPSVYYSVWNSVWVSVWNSVRISVYDSVRDSVWDSVQYSIKTNVKDKR